VQGCGLGLNVSVSRRTNVLSRSRLDQSAQRLGLVSVSTQNVSGLVEGLGLFRLVETFHAGAPNNSPIQAYVLFPRSCLRYSMLIV